MNNDPDDICPKDCLKWLTREHVIPFWLRHHIAELNYLKDHLWHWDGMGNVAEVSYAYYWDYYKILPETVLKLRQRLHTMNLTDPLVEVFCQLNTENAFSEEIHRLRRRLGKKDHRLFEEYREYWESYSGGARFNLESRLAKSLSEQPRHTLTVEP
jgi:hypothetical protein